jgi:hypothetical protein
MTKPECPKKCEFRSPNDEKWPADYAGAAKYPRASGVEILRFAQDDLVAEWFQYHGSHHA